MFPDVAGNIRRNTPGGIRRMICSVPVASTQAATGVSSMHTLRRGGHVLDDVAGMW